MNSEDREGCPSCDRAHTVPRVRADWPEDATIPIRRGDPLADLPRPLLSETGKRMVTSEAERVMDAAGVARGAARDIARLLIVGAEDAAGPEQVRRETGIDEQLTPLRECFGAYLAAAETALAPVADPVDGRRTAAAYWIWGAASHQAFPDSDALVRVLQQRAGGGPLAERWPSTLRDLARTDGPRAIGALTNAIVDEFADRTPVTIRSALVTFAKDTATDVVARGPVAWRGGPGRLRDDACHDTWVFMIERYAHHLPQLELKRLVGRSLLDRFGEVIAEDVETLRSQLFVNAALVDLSDDRLLAAMLRVVPLVGDRTTLYDPEIEVGDDSDDDVVADTVGARDHSDGLAEDEGHAEEEGDALQTAFGDSVDPDPVTSAMVAEAHAVLADAVAVLLPRMDVQGGVAARDAELLRTVSARGVYKHAEAIALAPAPDNLPVNPKNAIEQQMVRAYDRLRAGLLDFGFVMLDDPPAQGNGQVGAEDVAALLDCSSVVLPEGVELPADHPPRADGRVAAAIALELAGAPLERVVTVLCHELPAGEAGDAALRDGLLALKAERRGVRSAAQDVSASALPGPAAAGGLRSLYEPKIFARTELPEKALLPTPFRVRADAKPGAAAPAGLRAGRAVVLPGTALPIERRHGEQRLRSVIDQLPRPVVKTHGGRWWFLPCGGVSLPEEDA